MALNRSGLAESSVKRYRASLSAFFAWAVRERLIASNPVTATRVPKGRGARAEIRPFAEDELESFHATVSARGQRLADVLLVAAWTGLRWSELREARVRDFVRVPVADRVLPLVLACTSGKGPDDLQFRRGWGTRRSP